ncbi:MULTISPECIES: helix-turn-helix domain-containing protein [unclassified Aeromicrobium]|uniref:helix-turn-helix domain-containing protein n=1 Tax=unclassified Aeromicrobium TaxID=2633570 RepID=UPI00288B963F|nr:MULTISPECIES: helix-turn-helix domain-containing protein [unclassified Aeromicrobium]
MAGPHVPVRVRQSARELGQHVTTWRKLQNLTAAQLSERAGISRPTLRKLENGDSSVGLDTFLVVLRALGQLDRLVDSIDPYETDLGRARSEQQLPERVR